MTYKDNVQSVDGEIDKGLFLFTLSTCIWCRKTKALLQELSVTYKYVDIDLLEGADRTEAVAELRKYNPKGSFPTILVDGGATVILGFDETKLRGLVG